MTHDDFAGLREQYARQTAAWNELRERFASLPHERVVVAAAVLERLSALVPAARPSRPTPGVRA